MYTNTYVFRYAAVMVIVVAAILSAAALLLKPAQDRNVAIAKMQGILSAAQVQATADDAIELYGKFIVREKVIDPSGELVSVYADGQFESGEVRAFDIKLKEQLYNKTMGKDYILPLYEADKDGETLYIIPMEGKGLWGPIYGNVALKDDFITVAGATFSHKAETPGLGAEIDQLFFQEQFIGKRIFDENGNFTSIQVVKGGAKMLPASQQIHGVDAISGGTITSNGVTDMLKDNLESYVAYFKKQTKE
jgi:Na+-transporting NADH:ubiquinone oxidoreductase subunit C